MIMGNIGVFADSFANPLVHTNSKIIELGEG
jgi:hypothetical protein